MAITGNFSILIRFNEYQVLENLDLSFNQNKLKMDCLGLNIQLGRYIACALGSQELTNKMLFYGIF